VRSIKRLNGELSQILKKFVDNPDKSVLILFLLEKRFSKINLIWRKEMKGGGGGYIAVFLQSDSL
jgi:hypothetical protein